MAKTYSDGKPMSASDVHWRRGLGVVAVVLVIAIAVTVGLLIYYGISGN